MHSDRQSPLNILVVGEDTWSAHLAEGLNRRFQTTVKCSAVKLCGTHLPVLRTAWHLVRDDCVLRIGFPPIVFPPPTFASNAHAHSRRERLKRFVLNRRLGRVLRRIVLYARLPRPGRRRFLVDRIQRATRSLRPTRREFMYWVGTDVQNTCLAIKSDGSDPALRAEIMRHRNLTVAAHLTKELGECEISANIQPFPGTQVTPPTTIPLFPPEMTAISYVPDSRRDFYGWTSIQKAARALPNVQFVIYHGTGLGLEDVPENVRFIGYVSDIGALYARSSVVLRIVEHDGDSSTIAEALMFARPVIYTYEMPGCTYVPFGNSDRLVAELQKLEKEHLTQGIRPNIEGRDWAINAYDVDRRFRDLLSALLVS